MSDKIKIAGRLNVKGWHNKACEILDAGGVSTCIHCQSNNLLQKVLITNNMEKEKKQVELPAELQGKKFRIRKLTPRECFRLMGVDDNDIDKLMAAREADDEAKQMQNKHTSVKRVLSNSSLYKLAGNSIVVDVLFHLFRKMFIETGPDIERGEVKQLELF